MQLWTELFPAAFTLAKTFMVESDYDHINFTLSDLPLCCAINWLYSEGIVRFIARVWQLKAILRQTPVILPIMARGPALVRVNDSVAFRDRHRLLPWAFPETQTQHGADREGGA